MLNQGPVDRLAFVNMHAINIASQCPGMTREIMGDFDEPAIERRNLFCKRTANLGDDTDLIPETDMFFDQ